MDALGQRPPVQPRASADLAGHHQFTVGRRTAPATPRAPRRHLREVARRSCRHGSPARRRRRREDDGTESVPLRLVRPHGLVGRLFGHSDAALPTSAAGVARSEDPRVHSGTRRRLRAALRRRCRRSVRLGSFEHRDDGRRVRVRSSTGQCASAAAWQFQVALAGFRPGDRHDDAHLTETRGGRRRRTRRSAGRRGRLGTGLDVVDPDPRRSAQKRYVTTWQTAARPGSTRPGWVRRCRRRGPAASTSTVYLPSADGAGDGVVRLGLRRNTTCALAASSATASAVAETMADRCDTEAVVMGEPVVRVRIRAASAARRTGRRGLRNRRQRTCTRARNRHDGAASAASPGRARVCRSQPKL